jgi:hypothetical protein
MGISSDGMLYFGFTVGDEDSSPEWMEEYEEFEDFLCAKAGLPTDSPWQVKSNLVEACPASLEWYCSYEYPMYILAVRGASFRVNRGYVEEIAPADLVVNPERIQAFKTWCETNDIPYEEPKWLLCSMMG